MKFTLVLAVLLGTVSSMALAGEAPALAPASGKTVTFNDPEGLETGTAILTGTSSGLLIKLNLRNLSPGEHAFHIHENGVCDGAAHFESAGGHYNLDSDEHGYLAKDGHHGGDMPNLTVLPDGTLNTEIFNEEAELDEMIADNGTALMIHEKADDYTTQPSGNAGGRIACAVIK